MKLATLRDTTRDGKLVVVSRDNTRFIEASNIARTMQEALDRWDEVKPLLESLYKDLSSGGAKGQSVAVEK